MEGISISLTIRIFKTVQRGPAEIPGGRFPLMAVAPMQGLALVSGGSHHTLLFLPSGTLPVLETIPLSALAHVSRPWPGPRKYLPCCCSSFCDPCRGSKLSFCVRGHRLLPDGLLLHRRSEMYSSVLRNMFPQQLPRFRPVFRVNICSVVSPLIIGCRSAPRAGAAGPHGSHRSRGAKEDCG